MIYLYFYSNVTSDLCSIFLCLYMEDLTSEIYCNIIIRFSAACVLCVCLCVVACVCMFVLRSVCVLICVYIIYLYSYFHLVL